MFAGLPVPELGHHLWAIWNNPLGNRQVETGRVRVGCTVGAGTPLEWTGFPL